jgi:hypothetical protein
MAKCQKHVALQYFSRKFKYSLWQTAIKSLRGNHWGAAPFQRSYIARNVELTVLQWGIIPVRLLILNHWTTGWIISHLLVILRFVLFYVFLCCSMYCLFCVVLCIVCVYMCTVLLPPGGYPIAVKHITHIIYHTIPYIIPYHISYHIIHHIREYSLRRTAIIF